MFNMTQPWGNHIENPSVERFYLLNKKNSVQLLSMQRGAEQNMLFYFNTPSSFPTSVNAATAFSRFSRVCPADSCTLMRACPLGTTG